MEKREYVHRRKARYMAKILARFEELCEPELRRQGRDQEIEDFKGYVREKMTAMAIDSCEIIELKPGESLNWAAVELRDRVTAN